MSARIPQLHSTDREDRQRRAKAAKLIDAVVGLAIDGDESRLPSSDWLMKLDKTHRDAIADLAGVRSPSDTTWGMVVATLRGREDRALSTFISRLERTMTGDRGTRALSTPLARPNARPEPDDPFEGLPGWKP